MIYDVHHRTIYEYQATSSLCQNVIRMAPRSTMRQQVLAARISLDPQPVDHSSSIDYFGNRLDHFSIQTPHDELEITARSTIDVSPPQATIPELTPPWDEPLAAPLDAVQFRFDSPMAKRQPKLADFAKSDFPPGRPILEAAIALTTRIYSEFKYAPGTTEVESSVDDVFASRSGVCQDFAHLQIACLRSLGLPARYVSGYLATTPPPGKKRLMGADATHAWLAVYCDGFGWIDLDPTNNCLAGIQHLTCAWGRDYRDVAPVTGVFFGSGESKIRVAVDVIPKPKDAA